MIVVGGAVVVLLAIAPLAIAGVVVSTLRTERDLISFVLGLLVLACLLLMSLSIVMISVAGAQ